MRKLSVYIHIPFCVRKCFYCDFLSFPAEEEEKTAYVEALLKEIRAEAAHYRNYAVDTVFIGGGTPSLLSGEWIEKILYILKENFAFSQNPEITVEVNPGSAEEEKLLQYRSAGINRLSIGTQSVQDEELRCLGRVHNAEEFYETYRLAEKAGFSNINVDLISAVPGQTCASFLKTLKAVVRLKPNHLSVYSLIVEKGTPFYDWYGEGGTKKPDAAALPSEEEECRMDEQTELFLKEKGYSRYEISNYAKEGACCRHNLAYWRRYDYVGFGLGASSMVQNVRFKNTENMKSYVNQNFCREEHRLSTEEQMEEFMFLGLRLKKGVSRKEFYRNFLKELDAVYGDILPELYANGLLEGKEWISLTPYGRDISNYVMAQFMF